MSIQRFAVAAPVAYPANPQVVVPFEPRKLTFITEGEDPSKSVYFSLDGVNDHAKLDVSGNNQYVCDQRVTRIWIKGALNEPAVVIAES